jgi:hypothetical protein
VPLQDVDWETEDRGGIRSVQSTTFAKSAVGDELTFGPDSLGQLLRQYFATAERTAVPLIRVRWTEGAPSITLAWLPMRLIAMGSPNVDQSSGRSTISVPIRGGLVARPGGHLSISLTRHSPGLQASIELISYRPRGSGFIVLRWLYRELQARLHVHVGRRFLQQLHQHLIDELQARQMH